ncbi:MAG: Planctomycete cytochrome, partial [Phycisphaerales bacterium]|nr:Planctomycete cytochrome [Phycisphaerales bacterium]
MYSLDFCIRNVLAAAICIALVLSSQKAVRAADSDPANKPKAIPVGDVQRASPVDFEKEILPVLSTSCLACHNKTKAKAKLVLETPADIRKGGESGPAAVAGKGGESLLLKAAAHAPEVDSPMPPPHNSANAPDLTSAQLGLIRLWIDQGAKGEVRGSSAPVAWVTLAPDFQPIYAVAVSSDGQFAACGRGNRIDVYHLPTGRLAAHLTDPQLGSSAPNGAHRDMVESLSFSPDGMLLASGSYREIKLWRRPTPVKKYDLAGLGAATQCAVVSPDGKLIAVGDTDGKIRLFDASAGMAAGELAGHEGPVTGLNFSGDGSRLASCSGDKTVRVWDVSERKPFCKIEAPCELRAVTWAAGAKQIAAGGTDGIIRLWKLPDAADGEMAAPKELKGHEGAVNALAAFPAADTQLVSGGEDGTVRVWAIDSKQSVRQAKHGAAVTSIAIRKDGKRFASAGLDNSVKLWNAEDAKQLAEMKGEPALLESSLKSERALALATAEIAYCKTRITEAEKDAKTQTDRKQKAKDALAAVIKEIEAKQKALDTAKAAKETIETEITAAKKSAEQNIVQAEENLKSLKDSVDADRAGETDKAHNEKEIAKATEAVKKAKDALAAMKPDEKRKPADTELAKATEELKKATGAKSGADQEVTSAGQAADGAARSVARVTGALKAAETDRTQREADVAPAKKAFADCQKPFRSVAFSPDGLLLAAAGDDGIIHTFSSDKGLPGDVLGDHKSPLRTVAFISPTSLASISQTEAAGAGWDLSAPWKLERTLGGPDGTSPMADRVTSLDFSPDGAMLASGGGVPSRGGEVRIWDLATGKPQRSFDDVNIDTVTCLRYSPSGKRLACASADRFVRVIDLASGKVDLSLEGHQHHVLGVAWRRDGHTIASAGADNTLRFWNADTGDRK